VSSAVAIPWLCLAAASACLFTLVAPALTGMGRPYLAALPLAISVSGKACLAYLLFDGTLGGFARGMGLGELLSIPAYLWLLHRFVHVSPLDFLRGALPSAGVALAVGATCAAALHWLPAGTALPVLLLVAVLGCAAVWMIAGHCLGLAAITELKALLQARKPSTASATPA
jgi:O-antigen/teichoic acid export membrane protein